MIKKVSHFFQNMTHRELMWIVILTFATLKLSYSDNFFIFNSSINNALYFIGLFTTLFGLRELIRASFVKKFNPRKTDEELIAIKKEGLIQSAYLLIPSILIWLALFINYKFFS